MELKLKKSDSGGKQDWELNNHKEACFFHYYRVVELF